MEEEDYFLKPFRLYQKVFDVLEIKNVDIQSFSNEINNVFLENPPLISSGFDTFYNILIQKNKSISITSNTAFVGGEVITEFLANILDYEFDFMLYSDIERVAKPNTEIFERMKSRAAELNKMDRFNLNFIHIGDNVRTDVVGAELANGDGYLINDYSYM
jgi:FMN phosphatase YigB (HAD superfamily)